MATADAMPGYAFHEVGAGYIDVREAVEVAQATPGARAAFLDGDVAYASTGDWSTVADDDERLQFAGNWRSVKDGAATGGAFRLTRARPGTSVFATFSGSGIKLAYPKDRKGGVADLYVDGALYDTISFYAPSREFGTVTAIGGLDPGLHTIELRAVNGEVYFDGASVDGVLYASDVTFVEESQTFTGTMGPSVENLQTVTHTVEVGADATEIRATLGWTGLLDLDLYLLGPDGSQVASGATLSNPETLAFTVREPGTYTFQVTGYVSLFASYTLDTTVVRAVIE